MRKPCDDIRFVAKLPCVDKGEGECRGARCWEKDKEAKPRKLFAMIECPWIQSVRNHWRRKGYGK